MYICTYKLSCQDKGHRKMFQVAIFSDTWADSGYPVVMDLVDRMGDCDTIQQEQDLAVQWHSAPGHRKKKCVKFTLYKQQEGFTDKIEILNG